MFRFMRLFIDMLSSKALEKHKKELTRIKQELQASRLNLEAITQANKKLTTIIELNNASQLVAIFKISTGDA